MRTAFSFPATPAPNSWEKIYEGPFNRSVKAMKYVSILTFLAGCLIVPIGVSSILNRRLEAVDPSKGPLEKEEVFYSISKKLFPRAFAVLVLTYTSALLFHSAARRYVTSAFVSTELSNFLRAPAGSLRNAKGHVRLDTLGFLGQRSSLIASVSDLVYTNSILSNIYVRPMNRNLMLALDSKSGSSAAALLQLISANKLK